MSRYGDLKGQLHVNSYGAVQMPQYRCHKEVWALKIAEICHESIPLFTGATCRGSYALGSACGNCERCKWEKAHGPGLGAILVPADEGYGAVYVDAEYLAKHKPEVGGYFVVYKDGYRSFSPSEAFEDGYTRI